MKTFLILLAFAIAGYLIYANFIKEKEMIDIDGNFIRVRESTSLETPGVTARTYGHAEGTVKNLSEKPVKNIIINYMIDRQISTTTIKHLDPNQTVTFQTNPVMLRVMEPPFYLESVKFE